MDLAFVLIVNLAVSSPLWVPLVALAYAIGRKQFGLRFLFAVMTAEAMSLGLVGLMSWLAARSMFGE